MPTITKNQIIWDEKDWLAGLFPQNNSAIPILFNGFNTTQKIDPFRYLGAVCPGYELNTVTNSSEVTSMLRKGAMGKSNAAYAVGGDLVHKITVSTSAIVDTGTSPATGAFPHQIANATMSDIIRYDDGSSNYMYYSYNDSGGNSDVGRMKLSDESWTDNYYSTLGGAGYLSDLYEHPMVVGDDDILYIGDGNILRGINQTTAVPTALTLPRDNIITSFAKINPRTLVIFTEYQQGGGGERGIVRAWFWDYISGDPYKSLLVYGSSCGGAFEVNGTIGVFTSQMGYDRGVGSILVHYNLFDGQRFRIFDSVSASTAPIHGGVEVFGDMVYANIESDLYSFGSPYQEVRAGVHLLSAISGSGSGMLATFDDSIRDMLMSSGAGLSKITANTFDTASFTTSFANPQFKPGYRGQVNRVRIEFLKSSTGGLELQLMLNNNETTSTTNIFEISEVDKDLLVVEAIRNDFPFFNFLQVEANWVAVDGNNSSNAPIIRKVIVDYKEVHDTQIS